MTQPHKKSYMIRHRSSAHVVVPGRRGDPRPDAGVVIFQIDQGARTVPLDINGHVSLTVVPL